MANTILIGCRLPHGLIIDHPTKPKASVELAGINKAVILNAEYATTEVDAEFWAAWKAANSEHPCLKNMAIFEARSQASAESVAKEAKGNKTGFEKMAQNADGVKAAKED